MLGAASALEVVSPSEGSTVVAERSVVAFMFPMAAGYARHQYPIRCYMSPHKRCGPRRVQGS